MEAKINEKKLLVYQLKKVIEEIGDQIRAGRRINRPSLELDERQWRLQSEAAEIQSMIDDLKREIFILENQ